MRGGGLDEFEQGRAGGRVCLAPARLLWEASCAASAVACVGEGKGRGGLPTWRVIVFGSWREPGRILCGSVTAGEDSKPGKEAAASPMERGGLPLSMEVRNPRNGGAKCCATCEAI